MTTKGKLAWGLVLLVAVLHFDFWWWDSTTIVFGFVPLTLAFQVGITIGAALAWALVMRYAWPRDVEEWAAAADDQAAADASGPFQSGGVR
ncbi:MAG: hypothetical protein R3F49_14290 [Planctomycetota bacterium]